MSKSSGRKKEARKTTIRLNESNRAIGAARKLVRARERENMTGRVGSLE